MLETASYILFSVDEIYHLACPASPPNYMYNPIKTIKTSTLGTINMLGQISSINYITVKPSYFLCIVKQPFLFGNSYHVI